MTEVLGGIVASTAVGHRSIDGVTVHAGAVVDHHHRHDPCAVLNEPHQHVGGRGVEAVVDQIGERCRDGVVQADGAGKRLVRRKDLGAHYAGCPRRQS